MTKDTQHELNQSKYYDLEIKKHYDQVAEADKDSSSSTMADLYIRENETKFIEHQIEEFTSQQKCEHQASGGYATGPGNNNKFTILDVGCGNGSTLENLSNSFPNFDFQGIEFNDSLRQIASKRFTNKKIQIANGDIRNIQTLPDEKVDILICQRVLINLLDENDQKFALNNLVNLVNLGGLLIFIECFKSGLNNLNSARKEFELEGLPPAHHNLYLSDEFFQHESLKEFDNTQSELFSTHYFISRVLHETFLKANKKDFIRNSHFVSFFSKAFPKNVGNYSPLKPLSFTKI
jgi:ubiquinone/menaquinone biosynthesis C-methylase UbiE